MGPELLAHTANWNPCGYVESWDTLLTLPLPVFTASTHPSGIEIYPCSSALMLPLPS